MVDGSSTITFRNGGLQSSSYSLGALVWDARFSLGNGSGTLLELFFANPGLGAITGGPATVPLLARSTEIVGGVGAQIDNHSVSAVAEPGTFALMVAGIGLVGRTLRRRVTHFAPAVAT